MIFYFFLSFLLLERRSFFFYHLFPRFGFLYDKLVSSTSMSLPLFFSCFCRWSITGCFVVVLLQRVLLPTYYIMFFRRLSTACFVVGL